MKVGVYTLKDIKTDAFLEPFYSTNELTALRLMSNMLHDAVHPITVNKGDYDLYCLGEYDSSCAKFSTFNVPHFVTSLNSIPVKEVTYETTTVCNES